MLAFECSSHQKKVAEMKKVANITLHAINNYGSVYQSLATERLFEDLGCSVETIDYVRENAQNDTVWKILTCKGASPIIKLKMLALHFMPKQSNRKEVLDAFRNKYLHLTSTKYRCDKDLLDNVPKADIYCTGSDQTWNTVCQGEIPLPFFLHFAPEGKRKIAFSASFGISELPKGDKEEVKRLLKSYHAISVREAAGLSILNDLGLKGTHVLDPTVAVGAKFWDQLAAPRMYEEDYMLVYQLNQSSSFTKYMKDYAKEKGLKIVLIKARKDVELENGVCLTDVTPEELLSLFKYSSKVLTDSFHATVFSLMFHCDFMDIYPPKYSTRLDSILNMVGLQERHVVDFNRYDYCDTPINYDRVDSIIERERHNTIEFLKDAIS